MSKKTKEKGTESRLSAKTNKTEKATCFGSGGFAHLLRKKVR